MSTNVVKLISTALACGALSFAALAADAPPAAKDKEKVKKTVIVKTNGDDEPEVFEFNTSGDDANTDDRQVFIHPLMYAKGGYLGVGLTDLTPELRTHFGVPNDAGVMVSHVDPDSPAAKAGLKVGDIISGAGGKKVGSSGSLTSVVRKLKDGEAVPLEVWRDRKVQTITANVVVKERKQVDMLMPPFEIDQEKLKEMTDRLTKKFNSPEFQQKLQHQAELGKKMEELEKKMQELEKKLKDKSM